MHYGSTAPKVPLWSMENPIENIGHMVLLGGWEMNLLTYLSIRSMIHCVGVDAMYIYIDQEPKGLFAIKLHSLFTMSCLNTGYKHRLQAQATIVILIL